MFVGLRVMLLSRVFGKGLLITLISFLNGVGLFALTCYWLFHTLQISSCASYSLTSCFKSKYLLLLLSINALLDNFLLLVKTTELQNSHIFFIRPYMYVFRLMAKPLWTLYFGLGEKSRLIKANWHFLGFLRQNKFILKKPSRCFHDY